MGKEKFAGVDIRVRVKGGGHIAQIYGMKLATYGVRILQITCWLFLHDADLAVRKVLKISRRWGQKKYMCVYCHMSKKSRVGRSGLIFFYYYYRQNRK